jgi:aryl-alcohol dehydrogenase-like predicted oxidoreductase
MNDFAHSPATIRIGDLEVCRLGFGAMQIPGPMVWGEPKDPERIRAVLRRVLELGIQLIDTSWYYGPHVSNRFIAETLHPYAKHLVIATKLGGKRTPDKGWAAFNRPEELRQGCDEDLRGLRLDRIDVVHLRWIDHTEVPFREALDAMIGLQKEGKIRHLALSNVSLAQLRYGMDKTPIVGVQNLYNVAAGEKRLGQFPHAAIADQEQIVDLCAANGMAFLPFFPLAIPGPGPKRPAPAITAVAKRHAKTEAQIAIAWLLARSKAILPIAGTSSPLHLDENWNARTIALTNADIAEISTAREASA